MNKEPLRGEIKRVVSSEMQGFMKELYAFFQNDPFPSPSDGSITTNNRIDDVAELIAEKVLNVVEDTYNKWMIQHLVELEVKMRQEMRRRGSINSLPPRVDECFVTEEDVKLYQLGLQRK
jgi:hypothetical protein